MSIKLLTFIKDADFTFENKSVKIVANRDCPEIKTAGLKIGPFEEGIEYEVPYWVAHELEKDGIIRFKDGVFIDEVNLHKIHWKERVQPANQITSLQDNFYPRIRHFLSSLKEKTVTYDKIVDLSQDIVNCRLKKIVSLSSSSLQTDQVLRNLSIEERVLYDSLYEIINVWRSNILKSVGKH